MQTKDHLRRMFSVLIVLVLILLINNAIVIAQDGGGDQEESASRSFFDENTMRGIINGRVSISPFEFMPYENSTGYSFTSNELNAKWGELYNAPLSIPDGVTVTRLTLGYYDVNPDNYIWIKLMRQEIWGGDDVEMAGTDSEWPITGYHYKMDDTINYALIDQALYTYYIKAYFFGFNGSEDSVRLVGVRVEYQNPTTTYLPLIDN